jgi:hypothetical protein
VGLPYIGNNPINQVRRDIQRAWCVDRFDFGSIGKFSAISNMDTILSHIDIFHEKGRRLVVSSDD